MKLIDAFLFFNELDLLELRLHEMDPIVDHFVIVESLERFASGKPKDAVLRDNWSRFKQWEDKIVYHLLPKLEPPFSNDTTAWAREYFNRNALWPVIRRVAGLGDAVIISDCDEIPRASAVRDALPDLVKGIHRLEQSMYYYNVNQLVQLSNRPSHCWDFPVLGKLQHIQDAGGPQAARFYLRKDKATFWTKTHAVRNAGWHFTYFEDGGSLARMREKTESCCHFSDPDEMAFLGKSDAEMAKFIADGKAVRCETRSCVWSETDDPSLPEYFLKNTERFRHFTDAFFRERL